jgi:DNA-binding winged helix-turn-helix (wHTH) protein
MELAFADCVLNLTTRQLSRGGVAASLEPKMYTLLEVLIQRRPAVVTNEELDELLWPHVYVARTSLTRLVSELRAVLNDSPRDSRIIRTVYKTGYAFAAAVVMTDVHGARIETRRPAALVVSTGVALIWQERNLPLVAGENVAGRGAECSIVIDATTVSRRHALITVVSGGAMIEDLRSTNGTHVNRTAISTPTRLKDGDEIALGKAEMKLRIINPSAPTEVDPTRRSAAARAMHSGPGSSRVAGRT